MLKWVEIDQWKVKIEVTSLHDQKWTWSFMAVDGPKGESLVPADSSTAAYQQALGAAIQAFGKKTGPDSAHTDFNIL